MGLLRVDPALADARFILFAWLAPEFQQEIRRRTNPGSTVDRILLTELADFPIVCPPLDKQIAISRLLGALDDKIDLNHKINALVNELGYALFIEMTSRSNTPPRVDAVTTTVGELARVVGGSTPSTMNPTYWKDGTVAWATPKDLSLCSVPVLLDTERRITDLGAAQIGSRVLPAGTVLLSSRAPVGYLAIAEIPIAINQGFIAMVPKPPISSHFLLRWAQSSMDDIMARANGTTFQEISKRNFRPMTVSVPPRDRLEQFDAVIEPLHRLMVANLRQNRILAELRDLLLPKLVSGQIRIKDA